MGGAVQYAIKQSLITRVCCEAVRSAILAAAWLLVWNTARRRVVCTVCLFLSAAAKDIPASPVISGHQAVPWLRTIDGLGWLTAASHGLQVQTRKFTATN